MDSSRRDFLLGLGAVAGFAATGVGVYRHLRRQQELAQIEADGARIRPPRRSPVVPGLDYVRVETELPSAAFAPLLALDAEGRELPHDRIAGDHGEAVRNFAFAAELDFARARDTLAVEHKLATEPELIVQLEVSLAGDAPHPVLLPVYIDASNGPCLVAEEGLRCPHSSYVNLNEAMPTPFGDTVLALGSDGLRLQVDRGLRQVPPLQRDDAQPLFDSDTRYLLANRGAVTRSNRRTPWLFVADEVPWWQVVRVLEALAPVACRDHGHDCDEPWAILHVGDSAAMIRSLLV